MTLQLPHPTDHAGEIIQIALSGLDNIYREGYRYNKGGVMLSGLIPAEERQTSLLDPYDREKIASLMQALDQVNTSLVQERCDMALRVFVEHHGRCAKIIFPARTTRA